MVVLAHPAPPRPRPRTRPTRRASAAGGWQSAQDSRSTRPRIPTPPGWRLRAKLAHPTRDHANRHPLPLENIMSQRSDHRTGQDLDLVPVTQLLRLPDAEQPIRKHLGACPVAPDRPAGGSSPLRQDGQNGRVHLRPRLAHESGNPAAPTTAPASSARFARPAISHHSSTRPHPPAEPPADPAPGPARHQRDHPPRSTGRRAAAHRPG